ncbi:MAG: hypothetical protein J0M12_11720, partial [Deltaproteobacteria bacterium]|nr:hypothetical protein [Deltaproteobacteria bacterium]
MKQVVFALSMALAASFCGADGGHQPGHRQLLVHSVSAGDGSSFTTTRLGSAAGGLSITFDESATVHLVPSSVPGTWEGLYARVNDGTGVLPGIVVTERWNGAGRKSYAVSVGWDDPVQVQFVSGPLPFAGGATFVIATAQSCKCVGWPSGICSKSQCDDHKI